MVIILICASTAFDGFALLRLQVLDGLLLTPQLFLHAFLAHDFLLALDIDF